MGQGGIAKRLTDLAQAAVGWLPGGLAVAAVVACIVFAAISGSSPPLRSTRWRALRRCDTVGAGPVTAGRAPP